MADWQNGSARPGLSQIKLVVAMTKPAASTCMGGLTSACAGQRKPNTSASHKSTRPRAAKNSLNDIVFTDGKYYYQPPFRVIRITPNNLPIMILQGRGIKNCLHPSALAGFFVHG